MATKFQTKIEAYEVQPNGNVRVSTIFKLFQKISGDDLDKTGITYEVMRASGIVFVLTRMSVKFYGNIKKNDILEITTYPRGIKGISFIRDYVIEISGKRVAYASSTWSIIDINSRTLLRPAALEKIGKVPVDLDDYTEMDQARIKLEENSLFRTDVRRVFYSQIDENGHMNNTFYPDIIYDYLPNEKKTDFTGQTVTICYVTEAMCDEEVEVYSKCYENKFELMAKNNSSDKKIFTSIIDF